MLQLEYKQTSQKIEQHQVQNKYISRSLSSAFSSHLSQQITYKHKTVASSKTKIFKRFKDTKLKKNTSEEESVEEERKSK
jgi:hypothetical protein